MAAAFAVVAAHERQTPAPAPATGAPAQETAAQYQGPAAEQFLLKARIRQVRAIGEGVTAPQKVTLELDGVTRFAAFKNIDEKRDGFTRVGSGPPEANFQDSWQTEIPAYTVDLIIGLGWVPATVERRVGTNIGSLQWWVEVMMPEAERLKQKLDPPDAEEWNRRVMKMRLFDQLICNVDRHSNNILITKDWDLRLIDHSRSFRPVNELREPEKLTRFSKALLEGLREARVHRRQEEDRPLPDGSADSLDAQAPRRDPGAREGRGRRPRRSGRHLSVMTCCRPGLQARRERRG